MHTVTPSHCSPHSTQTVRIGGLVPYSSTDYPGKLAAVLFIQGCPWRCGYCHNPHLQSRDYPSTHDWSDILSLLERRIGLLDAVVFSGGEPTLDPGLPQAIQEVNAMGFQIGLHTAGMYPRRLAEVLPWLDWVGLDIKASFAHYDAITQIRHSAKSVAESLALIQQSQVSYECRTTIHPLLHSSQELLRLAQDLHQHQVSRCVLQVFRGDGCTDPALIQAGEHLLDYPGPEVLAHFQALFTDFTLRRG